MQITTTGLDRPRANGCPIDHTTVSQQKTARTTEASVPAIERDATGVWQVRSFAAARAILRSASTKQAGFKAELIARLPQSMNPPILYQEGQPHHQQRKQTARFFTPKAVSDNYRQLMERYAAQLIGRLQRRKRLELNDLSLQLAVRVAAEVIGLTNSRVPGMARRLNAFFSNDQVQWSWHPQAIWSTLKNQARMLAFFYLDVKPAIDARRKAAREDVISHLIGIGYGDGEILTECVTYGAAGMATTREFISVATWHLLEQPALRDRFVRGDEDERQAILQELLRLEPVVGRLYRRATADFEVDGDNGPITIAAGDLIDLHIYATNADEQIVGDQPLQICPARPLSTDKAAPTMLSFGDGAHRCPGAYVALQETDIFLQRLLAIPSLRVEQKPSVSWNELIAGYEIRNFVIAVD